jgi:hypothetical protein
VVFPDAAFVGGDNVVRLSIYFKRVERQVEPCDAAQAAEGRASTTWPMTREFCGMTVSSSTTTGEARLA